jgi:hypothetical protein
MVANGNWDLAMRSKFQAAFFTAIAFLLPIQNIVAQTVRGSDEYEVKAAFLYNFALYTEWPALPTEAFDFCILGKDPFEGRLNKIARKSVQGKAIHVRHLKSYDDVVACHLLFIPASEKEQYFRIAPVIKQYSILTITDAQQIDEKWPMMMISLVPKDELYTFDINLATAKSAGLTLSSKLLRLARSVK